MSKIYLASQSPRRREILNLMGVEYELLLPKDKYAAETLEAEIEGEAAIDYVQRVVLLKMRQSLAEAPNKNNAVLCADTTVALENKIFGKPTDKAHAAEMLRALSGKTHEVFTAVALGNSNTLYTALSHSQVSFVAMSEAQIEHYVSTNEPMGKAGGYAIQGKAANYIAYISGSYSGIMGLPMFETAELLRQLGYMV